MAVWSAKLSDTLAMSPSSTGAPPTTRTGIEAKSAIDGGLEFIRMLYSNGPMRAVPAGTITFDACSALTTSLADRPFAAMAPGSTSIWICRCLPPNGAGTARPEMVNSLTRTKFSS